MTDKKTITGVAVGSPPPDRKPKADPEPETTKVIASRLPTDLVADLDAICKEHNVHRSALVRFALVRFVDAYRAGQVDIPQRSVADI